MQYTRLQPTKNGYHRITVNRKNSNAKKKDSLLSRSIGFWLMLGVTTCSYTVHLGSVQPSLSAHGQPVASESAVIRVESNTSTQSAQIQQASVSAEIVKSEKQLILEYIVEVFGDDADRAIWVAKCESGLKASAINDQNRNGTVDYGVFQVNSVHIKTYGTGFTKSWKENVDVAKKIFDQQGFKPWVCAKSVGEKNYIN